MTERTIRGVMTLRLDVTQALLIESMARANGRSVAAEIREAVADHISERMRDPSFAQEARAHADEWAAFAARCEATE